ncbi:hypothetical protein L227DRAFT_582026 [Lentinus tigrinus ALCF2SS1-6]|uniref:Integrase zinc-binding domain-containing protein n=1 Tax=Lentinus tigrinus ALCF2SS1-6 TaxID=1328759 RepID=A0A5C2RNV0_9APHY|nr:hypothetical protein L227DRAFT_582026 [Lentinus tigrinus ALCF2SS1-6]
MPTREEFAGLQEQYLESLDTRKKKKALISQDMFDKIWLALHCPEDLTIETAQFRWWVRKMFALVHPNQLADGVFPTLESRPSWQKDLNPYVSGLALDEDVVVHDGKRVAVREHIYDILCICHHRVQHSGRDKTAAEIRKTFTWVPKELVALFVKNCPTCMHKKTGVFEDYQALLPDIPKQLASSVLCNSGVVNVMARYLPVSANNAVATSRSDLAFSPSACSLAPGDCGSLSPPLALAHSGYLPGPGPAAHAVDDHYTSQGNLSPHPSCWQVYPSRSAGGLTPSNSGWLSAPQDGALYVTQAGQQKSFVQLPSIPVDRGAPPPEVYYSHPTKVTLPSFSEVFSGGLTVDGQPSFRSRIGQPLQVLSHNVGTGPGGSMSLQVLGQHSRSGPMYYAPAGPPRAEMIPIDPALLSPGDGARMLAFPAEGRGLQRYADENRM